MLNERMLSSPDPNPAVTAIRGSAILDSYIGISHQIVSLLHLRHDPGVIAVHIDAISTNVVDVTSINQRIGENTVHADAPAARVGWTVNVMHID
jgi:hypothetical protein